MPYKDPQKKKDSMKKWYAKNRNRIKTYNEQYGKTHKEEISKNKKKYYKTHIERLRKKNNKYYETHRKELIKKQIEYERTRKEHRKEYSRKYRKTHKKERSFWQARRRAVKLNASGSHTIGEWENLKAQYNWTCPACRKKEPTIKLTRDHIIPLTKGGSNNIENLQPLCRSCNSIKKTEIVKYVYNC